MPKRRVQVQVNFLFPQEVSCPVACQVDILPVQASVAFRAGDRGELVAGGVTLSPAARAYLAAPLPREWSRGRVVVHLRHLSKEMKKSEDDSSRAMVKN